MSSFVSAEVVEPYAEALMSVAQSHDLKDRFGEEVNSLLRLLKDSEELRQFLASPIVDTEAKKAVLQQILGDQVHPYLRNFLMILVDRRRILFLEQIGKHYQTILRKLNQTVLAEVTSTVDLTEAQQQAICEKVTAMTGAHQVELETHLDPDLIGGVIIRVGSQVVDASLRGQLRRISLRLSSAA